VFATRTAPPPPLFGQLLGQAHRASSALLDDLLARHDTAFETWVTLNLLSQRDPGIDRDQFRRELATSLQTDAAAIERLLAQLEVDGLIESASANNRSSISTTPEGKARVTELRESISDLSTQLLGDVDPNDLAAARRVLEQMRIRAESLRR
jgi:DNA-binding MarR family transcriptional regulator